MAEKKEKNFLVRILCGFGIGFAFIVPGISGSAMAVLFGIYEDMIKSVSDIFKNFKKSFMFFTIAVSCYWYFHLTSNNSVCGRK